jgi:hypothetical protein
MKTSYRPVFDLKSGDAAEFVRVCRDHREIVIQGDGGNLQVVRSDDLTLLLQIRADFAVFPGSEVVERMGLKRKEQVLEQRQALLSVSIALCTRPKLCLNHRACPDILSGNALQSDFDHATGVFEMMNLNTGINEVGHHQVSRFSMGNSAGASKGSGPHSSAILRSQPFGQPFAVNSVSSGHRGLGTSNSFSTSFSSAALWSGGRVSRRWSSFMARVLTGENYAHDVQFASHQKGGAA